LNLFDIIKSYLSKLSFPGMEKFKSYLKKREPDRFTKDVLFRSEDEVLGEEIASFHHKYKGARISSSEREREGNIHVSREYGYLGKRI
jgi:hypothetical protein